jgi:pimeloyl-ACP methyl ester carboxylesterase
MLAAVVVLLAASFAFLFSGNLYMFFALYIGMLFLIIALTIVYDHYIAREVFPAVNSSLIKMSTKRLQIAEMQNRRFIWIFFLLLGHSIGMLFALAYALDHVDLLQFSGLTVVSFALFYFILYYAIGFAIRKSQEEERPFVLYLRTFSSDADVFTNNIPAARWIAPFEKAIGRLNSVERFAFRAVNRMGLTGVAVGAPGEVMPPLGFRRLWFSDAEWQTAVSSLIERCAAVILNSSPTHWVAWELREIAGQKAVHKLVLMTHARTAAKRAEHLNFAMEVLGLPHVFSADCNAYTIALSQLDKAEPLAIDAYPDDLSAFADAVTVGVYALTAPGLIRGPSSG